MGCSSPQNASLPNIPQQQLNRLLQVAQIGHPLNVNKKYQYLARIQQNKQVNSSYRKTYAYNALSTRDDLQEKRKQFWGKFTSYLESRTSGKPATWQLLRKIINAPSDDEGLQMLKAHRIHMLNGTIQMCLDSHYSKYQIPIFCINEPISYSSHREQKNLHLQYEDKSVTITIRTVKFPNEDIVVSQQTSTQIITIKETVRVMKGLNDSNKMRFFYGGRQMKDQKTIGNYGYVEGTIVQAMILN